VDVERLGESPRLRFQQAEPARLPVLA
jgi:hypothetical protein